MQLSKMRNVKIINDGFEVEAFVEYTTLTITALYTRFWKNVTPLTE